MYSPYHDNRPGKWPFPDAPIRGFAAVFHRVFSSGFFSSGFFIRLFHLVFSAIAGRLVIISHRSASHFADVVRRLPCCFPPELFPSSSRRFLRRAHSRKTLNHSAGNPAKKKPAMKAGKIAVLDA